MRFATIAAATGYRVRLAAGEALKEGMTETFEKWDGARDLRDREDVRRYLEACTEQDPGDGSLIRAALNDIARAHSVTELARETGMTPAWGCTRRWLRTATPPSPRSFG